MSDLSSSQNCKTIQQYSMAHKMRAPPCISELVSTQKQSRSFIVGRRLCDICSQSRSPRRLMIGRGLGLRLRRLFQVVLHVSWARMILGCLFQLSYGMG